MGRRMLSNAPVRALRRVEQRLAQMEREMRALKQRQDMERAIRLHEIQQANFNATANISAQLARSTMSVVNFSVSAQAAKNASGAGVLTRLDLLDRYRKSAQQTWRLYTEVHTTGGALHRAWRRLQLRLASRLLGFGAHP